MKKMIAIFMAVLLVLALAACGVENQDMTSEPTASTIPDETHVNENPTLPEEETTVPENGETVPEKEETEHVHEYVKSDETEATCLNDGYATYKCECGETYSADYVDAIGHIWGDWTTTVEPTKDSFGRAMRSCSVCNDAEERELPKVVDSHDHIYEDTITQQPTCTAPGVITYTCTCGDSYTEELVKTHHSYDGVVTEPTCTEQGYTTYTCSLCGDVKLDNYVNPVGHDDKWVEVKKATCSEPGIEETKCKKCLRIARREIEERSHAYKIDVVEPTCTERGYSVFRCSCGDSTVDYYTEPLGHIHNNIVVAPTCIEKGYTSHLCKRCGDSYNDNYVDPLGHDYEKIIIAPKCESKGYTTYVCARCDNKYNGDYVDALGHDWSNGKLTQPPTCTNDGVKTYTCDRCFKTKAEAIASTGHTYVNTVVKPTCKERGYTITECMACAYKYTGNFVDPLGHDWNDGAIKQNPTCTKDGTKLYTCKVCREGKTETIAKLGHDYVKAVTAPTCEAAGYTTVSCSRCDYHGTENQVKALGHDWDNGTIIKQPSCIETGTIEYSCEREGCGKERTDVIEKRSHKYASTVIEPTCTTEGYTMHTCEYCKSIYLDARVPATGHVNLTTKVVEPTCVEDGYSVTTCADCGESISTAVLESTGEHNYNTTKNLTEAASAIYQRHSSFARYIGYDEWEVQVCGGCGLIDITTAKLMYSDKEAAQVMLDYVNELRSSVGVVALKLDDTLIEYAKLHAKEYASGGIKSDFGITGNYIDGGRGVKTHFDSWCKNSCKDVMIDPSFRYFGYGLCASPRGLANGVYGAQLFWTKGQYNDWND